MMPEQDTRILEIACPDLMRKIDLTSSDLLAQLVRRAAITTPQKEFIQTKEGNRKQVEALVDILLRGDENTVDMLIHSLKASGYGETAAQLLRTPHEDDPYSYDSNNRPEGAVSLRAILTASKRSRDKVSLPSISEKRRKNDADPFLSHEDSEFVKKLDCVLQKYMKTLLREMKGLSVEEKKIKNKFLDILIRFQREVLELACGKSILFLVKCPSLFALDDLKAAVESGELRELFKADFFTPEWMARFDILFIDVELSINMQEYTQCRKELTAEELQRELEHLAIGGQEEVGARAEEKNKQIVLDMLDNVELNATALHNILRWWNGEISGKRCAKNVVEATAKFLAGSAGGAGGAMVGSAIAGPFGFVAGGILGAYLAYNAVSHLVDRLTQELFDLPKTEAEERAYNYLGVHYSVSNSEVNEAYRRLCRRHHPDRGGDKEEFFIVQNNMAVIKAARGELTA